MHMNKVSEFRIATAEIPAYDLRQSLAIHRRLRANPDARDIPLAMLCTITRYLPNEYPDWRELVNADQHAHVEELMRDYLERHPEPEHKKVVVPAKEQLFPPPALYFDRRVRRVVDMFQTDVEQGLRASQIEERRSFYGRNDLPAPPRPNVFGMLWTQVCRSAQTNSSGRSHTRSSPLPFPLSDHRLYGHHSDPCISPCGLSWRHQELHSATGGRTVQRDCGICAGVQGEPRARSTVDIACACGILGLRSRYYFI